jgi:hypothetical protein
MRDIVGGFCLGLDDGFFRGVEKGDMIWGHEAKRPAGGVFGGMNGSKLKIQKRMDAFTELRKK